MHHHFAHSPQVLPEEEEQESVWAQAQRSLPYANQSEQVDFRDRCVQSESTRKLAIGLLTPRYIKIAKSMRKYEKTKHHCAHQLSFYLSASSTELCIEAVLLLQRIIRGRAFGPHCFSSLAIAVTWNMSGFAGFNVSFETYVFGRFWQVSESHV